MCKYTISCTCYGNFYIKENLPSTIWCKAMNKTFKPIWECKNQSITKQTIIIWDETPSQQTDTKSVTQSFAAL